jgi:hypothetical protein
MTLTVIDHRGEGYHQSTRSLAGADAPLPLERSPHVPCHRSTVRPKVPFWHLRTTSDSIGLPPAAMAPYRFHRSGHVYDVRFTWASNCWSGTLHRDGDERGRQLITVTDALARELSDVAIRDGFISVAEWLVRTGEWSEPARSDARFSSPDMAVLALQ